MRPLVIVSDIHLGHRACDDVAADLGRLVAMHPGHEIVLNGDTFNLSCDPWARDPATSAAAMVAAHPALRSALEHHLADGGALTIVAGNHDAAAAQPAIRAALVELLAGAASGALEVEPWLLRRGPVHIEHGHLFDPGNSPTHPLAVPTSHSEPLGVTLTRRFIGPYRAWSVFADQWAASNADNLKVMLRHFGARTPLVVLHYCALLAVVNAETAWPSRLATDRRLGDEALADYAARRGLTLSTVRGLLDGRPRPFHFGFWDTFLRFRFDGLLATAAIPAGVVGWLLSGRLEALALSALGLTYLVPGRSSFAYRGANHMLDQLRQGAALVRRLTGADLVIFGHTHTEDAAEGYLNLGAFGDRPSGSRTYVHVDEEGRVERRRL